MSEVMDFIENIKNVKAEISTVLIVNPESIKVLEEETKKYPNVYLIEDSLAKPNTAIVIKDRELKKILIEAYESRKAGANNG